VPENLDGRSVKETGSEIRRRDRAGDPSRYRTKRQDKMRVEERGRAGKLLKRGQGNC
jgi:hypothetical protein